MMLVMNKVIISVVSSFMNTFLVYFWILNTLLIKYYSGKTVDSKNVPGILMVF